MTTRKTLISIAAAIALGAGAGTAVLLSGSTGVSSPTNQIVRIIDSAGVDVTTVPQPAQPLPTYGSLVHLKGGNCAQRVSVAAHTQQAGGKGMVIVSDPSPINGSLGYHWFVSTSAPTGVPTTPVFLGRMYAGTWQQFTFTTTGSYSYSFASSDCPSTTAGRYIRNATIVYVKIT